MLLFVLAAQGAADSSALATVVLDQAAQIAELRTQLRSCAQTLSVHADRRQLLESPETSPTIRLQSVGDASLDKQGSEGSLLLKTNGTTRLQIEHDKISTPSGVSINSGGDVSVGSGTSHFYMGSPSTKGGMAYSPTYPDYGIFYKEGSPDEIHLSPNGEGTGGGAPLIASPGKTTINPLLSVDTSGVADVASAAATPKIELLPCSTCGEADPYLHFYGQSRNMAAEGFGIRYKNNVGDAYVYTGHPTTDSKIRFWTRGEPTVFNSASGGGERLVIEHDKISTPSGVSINSGGDIYVSGTVSYGALSQISDGRLKVVRANFTQGLAAVNKLRPREYSYRKTNALNIADDPATPVKYGFVAQEVADVLPEAVAPLKDGRAGSDGLLAIDQTAMLATLVNAVRELHEIVASQQAQIDALQQRQ